MRARFLVVLLACLSTLAVSFGPTIATVGAASVPSVSGVWLAYVPPTIGSPNQTFVMHNVAGSTRITGTWGPFKLTGTISPSTGTATLCAGCQEAGITQTTNWKVKFVYRSSSTAKSNHPTFSGSYHYVEIATGQTKPGGPMRAVRCSYATGAKAVASC